LPVLIHASAAFIRYCFVGIPAHDGRKPGSVDHIEVFNGNDSGDANSGKSFNFKQIVNYLADLSRNSKGKKSKVGDVVQKSSLILAAFGNAFTQIGPDSSMYVRYEEYQFSKSGRMIGAKFIPYLLNVKQITNEDPGSQNFHIFYQLLAGASHEEREEWSIRDENPQAYVYLSRRPLLQDPDESAKQFKALRKALKSVGIGRRQQKQIYQTLAAILQIGQLHFQQTESNDGCEVKNKHTLELVAKLLGLDIILLEKSLTHHTKAVNQEKVSKILSVTESLAQRDALARTLYQTIFAWITELLNEKYCRDDLGFANFIGILDVPGLVAFDRFEDQAAIGINGNLHTFLTNYTNERLFDGQKQRAITFQEDLISKGMVIGQMEWNPNNQQTLELCSAVSIGLLNMLCKHTVSSPPVENADISFVQSVIDRHGESPVFVPRHGDPPRSFGISHFGGRVTECISN
jgi:chitin synthase